MSNSLQKHISNKLEARKSQGLFRSLVDTSHLIDFSSNDYLGLGTENSAREEVKSPESKNRPGSRLITGHSKAFDSLEDYAAGYFKAQAALFFNSGYDANLGLFSSLLSRGDTYLYDQYSHASIKDGIRLSSAKAFSFRHNDLADLHKKIKKAEGKVVVITESIFSMDGDFAPLEEIALICIKEDCALIVDEAHATGIYGEEGEGRCAELGIEEKVFARIHTMGKAVASIGAFVIGSQSLKEFLINYARSFIYTTAATSQYAADLESRIKKVAIAVNERKKLEVNISHFLDVSHHLDLAKLLMPNSGAIQILNVGEATKAIQISKKLEEKGYYVKAIISPTVAIGTERLRICIHAHNSKEEIEGLLKEIKLHV